MIDSLKNLEKIESLFLWILKRGSNCCRNKISKSVLSRKQLAYPRHCDARDSITTGVRRNVSRDEWKRVSRECAGRASTLKQTFFRLLFGYIRANEESGPFTFQAPWSFVVEPRSGWSIIFRLLDASSVCDTIRIPSMHIYIALLLTFAPSNNYFEGSIPI